MSRDCRKLREIFECCLLLLSVLFWVCNIIQHKVAMFCLIVLHLETSKCQCCKNFNVLCERNRAIKICERHRKNIQFIFWASCSHSTCKGKIKIKFYGWWEFFFFRIINVDVLATRKTYYMQLLLLYHTHTHFPIYFHPKLEILKTF